jgi:uncharacterized membrane protein
MHLIIILLIFAGLAAIIVWIADWTAVRERRSTALSILNRRLARGEASERRDAGMSPGSGFANGDCS